MRLSADSPRGKKALATRARVLDAARRLFEAQGYERVGVREVAAAVKMSTGAIFAHFESKADLWRFAMRRPAPDLRRFVEEIASHGAPYAAANAKALLKDLFGP